MHPDQPHAHGRSHHGTGSQDILEDLCTRRRRNRHRRRRYIAGRARSGTDPHARRTAGNGARPHVGDAAQGQRLQPRHAHRPRYSRRCHRRSRSPRGRADHHHRRAQRRRRRSAAPPRRQGARQRQCSALLHCRDLGAVRALRHRARQDSLHRPQLPQAHRRDERAGAQAARAVLKVQHRAQPSRRNRQGLRREGDQFRLRGRAGDRHRPQRAQHQRGRRTEIHLRLLHRQRLHRA